MTPSKKSIEMTSKEKGAGEMERLSERLRDSREAKEISQRRGISRNQIPWLYEFLDFENYTRRKLFRKKAGIGNIICTKRISVRESCQRNRQLLLWIWQNEF